MNAAELMTEDPRVIQLDAPVYDAVEMLQTLEVRHLPVVNEAGELVGMLSDRDLRALMLPSSLLGAEAVGSILARAAAPVSTIMSSDAVTVDPEDDVRDVIDRMLEHNIGAVPVVDADHTLVGIISYVDVLRRLAPAAS